MTGTGRDPESHLSWWSNVDGANVVLAEARAAFIIDDAENRLDSVCCLVRRRAERIENR